MVREFDVFLSHNSRDKPAVMEVGERLRARGLRVWLDAWELRPGLPWQSEIERGMEASNSVAVFVGKDGIGPWQEPEMRDFIDRSRRETVQVIPVLLPGAAQEPNLPRFLRAFTWVDFRNGLSENNFKRLVWGIKAGEAPDLPIRLETRLQTSALHNLPFDSLGSLLKGRKDLLEQLGRDLGSDPATALTQKQVLSGLGGIGKTRLAVEYAWRSGLRYSAIFFIRADSPVALNRSLAQLAEPTVLNLGLAESSEPEVLAAVLRWLRENPGWLLILDNVDTTKAAAAVKKLLPQFSGGHVLLTSRLSRWPREIGRRFLDTLELEDAIRYLFERTEGERLSRDNEEQAIRELAVLLDGLPLALEQAASYIVVHGHSFEKYLEAWYTQRKDVLEWYDEDEMHYPSSVAVTWQQSFEQLGPGARIVLRLLSHFAPDPIAVEILNEELIHNATTLYAEEFGQKIDLNFDLAVAELVKYSFVSREGANVSTHRMVQEVVRERIPQELRIDWGRLAAMFFYEFSPEDTHDVKNWDPLRPHAARIIKLAEDFNIETASLLMNQLGLVLYVKSLHDQAELLMRRALLIDEKRLGKEHTTVATRLNNLALLLQTTNRFAEAEQLMRRAMQIDEKSFGKEHPKIATCLNNLAHLLQATNRLSEAEPLMRRALKIDENFLGEEHPALATHLGNLAHLLQVTNRLSEAEPLMRRALKIDEKSFGEEHPNVALRLSNLAVLLHATNRLSEAEVLLLRALQIDEKLFGKEHPNVARDLNNLAQLLQATNRLSEAEPLMLRALRIDEKSFGEEHPHIAMDLNNLAQLLQATNRLSEAEPLMRKALKIDEKSFGEEHPNVARDLNNLAQLLQATNRLSEAEPLMRKALKIDEKSFGEEHPNVAIRLSNLARILQATKRFSEAEPLMLRALKIDEKSLGDEHPTVAIRLNNLAHLLQVTRRFSEAEPLMRRALKIDEKSLGDEHPTVATRLNNLADLLQATKRFSEAEPLMRRAVQIYRNGLGGGHPWTQMAQSNLQTLIKARNRVHE